VLSARTQPGKSCSDSWWFLCEKISTATQVSEGALLMVDISGRDSKARQSVFKVEGEPDTCPICHRGIQPIDSKWDFFRSAQRTIERVFICPVESCQHLFIARYYWNNGIFFLDRCVPKELKPHDVPDEVRAISPDFCDIYVEADKAEQLGLRLVCGPGYRKALEFLIKDYLTLQQTPEEAKKKIAELPLMACIKEFVTDSRVNRWQNAQRGWVTMRRTIYVSGKTKTCRI
jgi:hypothetical protein